MRTTSYAITVSRVLWLLCGCELLLLMFVMSGCHGAVHDWRLPGPIDDPFVMGLLIQPDSTGYTTVSEIPDLVDKLYRGFAPAVEDGGPVWRMAAYQKGDAYRVVWFRRAEVGPYEIQWVEIDGKGCFLDSGKYERHVNLCAGSL